MRRLSLALALLVSSTVVDQLVPWNDNKPAAAEHTAPTWPLAGYANGSFFANL